jgi:threonine dehydrogenase-like Zn-dependent dehydrogenase
MAIVFTENRSLPRQLRSGLGDTNFFDVLNAPINFLKGVFVDKPEAQAAAQVAIAQQQAQMTEALAQDRAATMRTVMMAGAGIVALLAVVIALKPRRKKLAGYRRRHRR